ncbi:MAG TPA: PSD1 and planctomycete cytochrome C domain-containing protein [Gemmataceae bacterium]|jgi:hypothetical protein|nr:PSD1 and planctomycete cytochrome C domain-containing protein [Gemmataceae bacterium]
MTRFLLSAIVGAVVTSTTTAAPVDFTRDVRPILSQHCFKCHGPDDNARKAGFRLDQRASALTQGPSGEFIIVPGKPGASELVRRVHSDDETDVMPPPATKKPLTDAKKAILKQWVAEGAEYADHWSLVAPNQAALPKIRQTDWPKNAIDHFVLAKLEATSLKPSSAADRYTLVRRVYLDLIGLPPTPAEADTFVNDKSANAYESLVDRLLKSPSYGERWARRWLDLARYADTNGYEKDRQRIMWPYRDWVIEALNQDLPFDQFTIQQLAGDLLPGATLDQKIATGFHRNTMLNEEGGADPLEFRWHAVNDRVATTGTVWLGLTLNCCQCHNHKFDPITQKEYYQFAAFLNNCDEPTIDVPTAEIANRRAELAKQIEVREAGLAKLFPPDPLAQAGDPRSLDEQRTAYLEARFNAWLAIERAKATNWTVRKPTSAKGSIPTLTVEPDGSVFVSGDKSKHDVYDLAFTTDLRNITALRIEALPDDRLPNRGPGRVNYEGPFGDFFLCEVTLKNDGKPQRLGMISADYFDGNSNPANAADGDPLTGWSINGGQGKPHAIVFNFAEPIATPGQLELSMLFEKYYAAGLGKFRVSVTTDNKKAEARGLPAEIETLVLGDAAQLDVSQRQVLMKHFLSVAPELKGARDEIKKLRDSEPRYPTALVMVERPASDPRPTFIHKRGEFTQPTEKVKPGVPASLPPLPAAAADRLVFARWLVSGSNPLTARVTVNRAWAAFFGRGIVRTTEDFGYQGEPPTHPELLDWLAVEFVKNGWSMKKLHKLIVMSATYQQASKVTPDLLEKDPRNELLSRGPRFRLEAEEVRDSVLKASGLLSSKIGGPSVFPPQPASVTAEGAYGSLKWEPSPGEDRYRRGLYTFTKRTAPFAMTTTFDGPSGEACVARRELSNTPMQALTLLNDAVFVEAAQTLGRQMAAAPGATDVKARELFRRCLIRLATDDELKPIVAFFEAQRKRFADKAAELAELSGGSDVVQPLIDRAAWTAVARAILNLDEMVTKE